MPVNLLKKTMLSFIALTICIACEKQVDSEIKPIFDDVSEQQMKTFSIDNENHFYFVSWEVDKDIEVPLWSSYLPMKYELYLQKDTNSYFELINADFKDAEDIKFDSENTMIIQNYLGIFRIHENDYTKLFEGSVNTFDIDSKNTIWTGGYNSGLIKINPDGDITRYSDTTGVIPTNGISYIFVDERDVVWVALWNNQGILKIENEDWLIFNATNSNLPSQNIWAIDADKNNHIWIGTGFDDNSQSLMRFNGTDWENMTPKIGNEVVQGTIRKIVSGNNKTYVISEQTALAAFDTNILLSYDGEHWQRIHLFPENEYVLDMELDTSRNVIWFLTAKNKMYKLEAE